MSQPSHSPAGPPSYHDAITELPTHFELLSMTPARLDHQAKVEQLEHERRVRAAVFHRAAPLRIKAAPSHPIPRCPHNTATAPRSTPSSHLYTRLSFIAASGFRSPPHAPTNLSKNAQNLASLLRHIMNSDYKGSTSTHIFYLPLCWADRHITALHHFRTYPSTSPVPPVLARRRARIQEAAQELGIPFETVRTLMLQHRHRAARKKFSEPWSEVWQAYPVRRDLAAPAVEMCRDAYWVIPVVARGDREAATLLEGVVKRARVEELFQAGHVSLAEGFLEVIQEKARWYRVRANCRGD
ncbi:hypothetical protein DOTSEDRAFT_28359 [Dothistroma septosporum NZE10]|uniref:Uncharacterized protein n=1 Tax=Dothistroma septosporum (strain NZE10 / CBS 128990) TaxID=675120 RepID=M2Y1K2_DOTSN|nr:hypothetical protein DOTSEDRAFT_28359 [Dothistroma septosporum NZE10]